MATSNKEFYLVELAGCDDTTEILIDLSTEEVKLLERVAELSKTSSHCQCQPRLGVTSLKSERGQSWLKD